MTDQTTISPELEEAIKATSARCDNGTMPPAAIAAGYRASAIQLIRDGWTEAAIIERLKTLQP